jgi:hypothetical protein
VTTDHLRISVGRGRSLLPDPAPENQELFKRYEALRTNRRRDLSSGGWRPTAITIWTRSSARRWPPSRMDENGQAVGHETSRVRRSVTRARRPPFRRPDGSPTQPVLDCGLPGSGGDRRARRLYYAYATQTLRDGEWINIQVARSRDLVHWQHWATRFPNKPAWRRSTQDFWAPYVAPRRRPLPDVLFGDARRLRRPARGHCLAIATARSPAGPFVDMGCRCCSGWASSISTRWSSTTR